MTPTQRLGVSLAGCLALGAIVFATIQWWSSPAPPSAPEPTAETAPGQADSARKPERQDRIEQLEAEIEAQRQALREARQQRDSVAGETERLRDELSAIQGRLEDLRNQVDSGTDGQGAGTTGDAVD